LQLIQCLKLNENCVNLQKYGGGRISFRYSMAPPQSSGGAAQLPPVHTGKVRCASQGRTRSRRTSSTQPSVKSYSYRNRSPSYQWQRTHQWRPTARGVSSSGRTPRRFLSRRRRRGR
jgi:hypothetical protein